MQRKFYAIIRLVVVVFVLMLATQLKLDEITVHAEASKHTDHTTTTTTTTSQQQQQQQEQQQQQDHEQQLHPSLLVDTKYWIRSSEFGERDNWRDKMKPCTLLERIKINEWSVVSMGDSLDSLGGHLEANIKQLTLAQNGMLLLEEDSFVDPIDAMFIQYLNESGDCLDSTVLHDSSSSTNNNDQQEQLANQQQTTRHLFEFEMDRDQMSWFNAENWVSSLNEGEINDWIPDSHRIPCSEDVVVFGSRLPTIESNERARVLSFKVHFEPSSRQQQQQQQQQQTGNQLTQTGAVVGQITQAEQAKVNQLRVSKLKIGQHFYNQAEFEQLLKSDDYENILFQFNSTRSLLQADQGFDYPPHSLLIIDESSLLPNSNFDFCLDEAGCLCGNEQTNIMEAICSFILPIEPHEQPCHDPILSTGYCSKICATIITITMDPTRFKEKFLINVINKLLTNAENADDYAESVFTGGRRTYDNKYEITFRHGPIDSQNFESRLGHEREFAQLVYQQLDNRALRSFYGIRTLNIKSSTEWKRSNRLMMFLVYLPICMILATVMLLYELRYNSRTDSHVDAQQNRFGIIRDWSVLTVRRIRCIVDQEADESDSFARFADSNVTESTEQVYTSTSGIPLVKLENP